MHKIDKQQKEENKKANQPQPAAGKEEKGKHRNKKKGKDLEEQPMENSHDELTAELESTRQEIKNLQNQVEEANDKFLRLFSEFDNYRKRVTRERLELAKTAAEGVISALLPVLDDLERASQSAMEKGSEEAEQKGIILIYNKFKSILKQKGVEEIPAVGEDFNTDFHDAITHMPAEAGEEKGKVKEEVQKGYMLNGKVIRHARVVVAN